jgi:hypothetical protein
MKSSIHPIVILDAVSSDDENTSKKDSLAPFCVGELEMIIEKVFLVPRILLHSLVVLNRFKDNLAEAIEVGDVTHLWIKQVRHEVACTSLIVYLVTCLVKLHAV